MEAETNKQAVRDCYELAASGKFEALSSVLSPDYVLHPDEARGVDGLAEVVERYRSAFSGLRVTIDQQFTEGDYVATRATVRGRHDGDLMGAPPSGQDVEFTVLAISRCRDGRIEEEWELADTMTLLTQIGALPEPAGV